jgi:hypothetical protein
VLLAHGHTNAESYTAGRVLDEARIVEERVNSLIITQATLLHQSVMTGASFFAKGGAKKANGDFVKMIKRLSGDGEGR